MDGEPDVASEELGVAAWWTTWPGAVVRVGARRIELPLTRFLTDTIYPRLVDRFGNPETIRIIHDWSSVRGYDLASRVELTKWMLAKHRELPDVWIVGPQDGGAIVRMGISTGALALRGVGVRIHVCDSTEEALDAVRSAMA